MALYAKDSVVTLAGTTINLFGDNSLGLYLDGTTSFTGSGNININGQNVVLFNMNSSGAISNSFNVVSVAPGSTYTLGNITGGVFEYTGSSNLASNGTLVSGTNSAIYLSGSAITAAPGSTNVAGVALDGPYTGISPLPAGMTPGTDGENAGNCASPHPGRRRAHGGPPPAGRACPSSCRGRRRLPARRGAGGSGNGRGRAPPPTSRGTWPR